MDCCDNKKEKKASRGFFQGIVYGLLPHAGCIALIIVTVLGIAGFGSLFKAVLGNNYFMPVMTGLSFSLATVSALYHIKKNGVDLKFLAVLYSTVLAVNVLMLFVIFPAVAVNTGTITGAIISGAQTDTVTLSVAIPCPGHAPLIIDELKKVKGVGSVEFELPNHFNVNYDPSITSPEQIIKADIFDEFKAKIINN